MRHSILKSLFLILVLFNINGLFAQDIQFTVKFDPPNCTYGVYATPDFTQANFFVAGGTQLTVVVPSSVSDSDLIIISENGGPWADNSTVYAPAASTGNDFHAITSNGSPISFTNGSEVLLFTFTLPDSQCCAAGIRLFENGSDPQSTAPGMAGGDFNNYFADAFFLQDHYNGNYNNVGTICDPCLISPVATPTTSDSTPLFCPINSPDLGDIAVNETNIRWYAAATGGTPLANSTLLIHGTTYYAAQFETVNNCESAIRLPITVTVGNAPTPTTTDNTQLFCAVNTPRISNIQVNETGVVWYSAATGGSVVAATTLLTDGVTYYGSLTDAVTGCISSVRLAVTITVDDAATPTTSDTTQDFCLSDTPRVSDIDVNETGVVWYTAATGGSIIVGTTQLTDGLTYYGSLTNAITGCASSVRLAVTVNVNSISTPTTTDNTQAFCVVDNPTVANLQVNESGVVWYSSATGGTVVSPTTALVNGNTYYGSLTDAVTGCISAVRLAITVAVTDAGTPTTDDTTQDFCLIDAPTVGDIQVNEAGVVWYNAATAGTLVPDTTLLTDGTVYYAAIEAGSCSSSVRLAVTVSIDNAPTPTTGDTTQDFCRINNPTVASIAVNQAGVVWYTAATGGSIVANNTPLVSGTYYGSLTDAVSGCTSAVRLAVTVTVGNAPTPTTNDTTQDFCQVDAPQISDIDINESGIIWYTAATGGTVVPNTTAITNGTTYYASLTDALTGCESSVRLAITVSVNDAATPTTIDSTQEFCSYSDPTIANLQVNEAAVSWYTTATGGAPLATSTPLTNGTIYYGSLTAAGCISSVRMPVTVTLTTVCDVTLNLKVMLQGALFGATGGLMRDDLRTQNLIPLTQPYSAAVSVRFTHVNGGGNETTTTAILNANAGTGDAIVDWVFIEIRSAASGAAVLKTVSALVQRDGDIVASDGGALLVSSLPQNFRIAIKHRNHLGAMNANALTVINEQVTLDFTSLSGSAIYSRPGYSAGESMATLSGIRALYAGNGNIDMRTKYDGVGNDRQQTGAQVLGHVNNTGQVLNYSNAVGYYSGDINMDGKALYDGANNDRQITLNIIIAYPLNTANLNNYNDMIEQLP